LIQGGKDLRGINIILIILVMLLICIFIFRKKQQNLGRKPVNIKIEDKEICLDKEENTSSYNEEIPISFGYKSCWIAIKSNDIDKIINSLNLSNIKEANWTFGLKEAQNINGNVFVSPILGQWVLVIGVSLPDAGDSERPDKLTPLLENLSLRIGEVQYFGTHRVVDYHAWAKVVDGNVIRAYAYLGERGETIWSKGKLTDEEKELGFYFFDETSNEAECEGYWERQDLSYPNEENVLQIAGKWGIDTSFENGNYTPSKGLIGHLKI
jgi:hypothetical protein